MIKRHLLKNEHCVKSVRIRSYSGPCFPAFGLNTDQNNSEFGHFLRRGNNQYKLQHTSQFSVPNVRSTFQGVESLSYLGKKMWDIVPVEIKEL